MRPNTVTCGLLVLAGDDRRLDLIGLILTLTSPIWDLAVNAATRQGNVSLQGTMCRA